MIGCYLPLFGRRVVVLQAVGRVSQCPACISRGHPENGTSRALGNRGTPDGLLGSAKVVRRIHTPVCLDEAITSAASAATALVLWACSVVNVKPGRVSQ